MNSHHHILSAVLVVIAGTIATWAHHAADWIRHYDPTHFNE